MQIIVHWLVSVGHYLRDKNETLTVNYYKATLAIAENEVNTYMKMVQKWRLVDLINHSVLIGSIGKPKCQLVRERKHSC